MSTPRIVVGSLILAVGLAIPALAQESVTLESVLSRVRERAPAVLVARSRIEEARSARVVASARLQENPEISGAVGPRWAAGETLTDFSVGVSQFFETGGRRASRIAIATADIDAAAADADRVLVDTLREAATRYHRLVFTIDLIDVLSRARTTAADVERAAARRFALGDIAVLDVNVARTTRARAEAEESVARGDLARQLGELAALLNWPGLATAKIEKPATSLRDPNLEHLIRGLASRPDLMALDAMRRSAEAEQRLAVASRRPEFGVSLDVDREEGAPAIIGGFVLRLPLLQRSQGQASAAAARVSRLRLELESVRAAAESALRGAVEAYQRQVVAVRALETDAVPAVGENEQLARRSYEAGQISLADWLLYRREFLETEREYLDRKLLCAVTLVELDTIAGVLR